MKTKTKVLVSVWGISRCIWYFEPNVQVKDDEDIPLKQIISCFDTIWKKKKNKLKMIFPTSKKKTKKKKKYFKKKINIILKNQSDLEKLHLGCQEVEIKLRFSS